MKAIIYKGPEPKVVDDGKQKYLLYPAHCSVRVRDLDNLDVPGGRFVGRESFWEAIAKVFGIVVTDQKIFRGNNGYGLVSAVMQLANELGLDQPDVREYVPHFEENLGAKAGEVAPGEAK